jgi:hypothetical protein
MMTQYPDKVWCLMHKGVFQTTAPIKDQLVWEWQEFVLPSAEVLRLTARIAALEAVVAAGDGLAEAAQNMADYGTVLAEQKYHRNLDTALTNYRAAKEAANG